MPGMFAIVLSLTLALVLLTGGIAGLRHPDDLAGWAALGVPRPLRRGWLLRLHPWAEIALGAALALLGGVPGTIVALLAVAVLVGYLVLVWRALARGRDAACACFGTRAPITAVTVVRNAWLVVLAVAAAALIGATPTLGGATLALLTGGAAGWVALAGAAVAAVTVALVLWRPASRWAAGLAEASVPAPADADGDYARARTPAVPVVLADGTGVDLRTLTRSRPLLLLAVSPGCAGCATVVEAVGGFRALLPELEIRMLLSGAPGVDPHTERDEPQSLHDEHGYVRSSIHEWEVPAAVLLGADGMLAGGPVSGADAIIDFVREIRASLDAIARQP